MPPSTITDPYDILRTARLPAGFSLPPTVSIIPDDHFEEDTGPANPAFEDAVAVFETDFLPHIKPMSARRYRFSLNNLARRFAGLLLTDITKARLRAFIESRRQEGVTDATIRRDLACLSSMFQFVKSFDWIRENPVRDLDKRTVKEATPRHRYLSKDEEVLLLQHAAPHLVPIITFAIETGMRLEEQLSLEWSQVDLDRREVMLLKTKTNAPRIVPLTKRALTILQNTPRHWNTQFVFHKGNGARYRRFTRGLAGAVRRAGLPHVKWHDLRRTCGCRLLQEYNVDIFKVSKWLGHASVMVTERAYAFLRVDDLHAAIGNPQTGDRP